MAYNMGGGRLSIRAKVTNNRVTLEKAIAEFRGRVLHLVRMCVPVHRAILFQPSCNTAFPLLHLGIEASVASIKACILFSPSQAIAIQKEVARMTHKLTEKQLPRLANGIEVRYAKYRRYATNIWSDRSADFNWLCAHKPQWYSSIPVTSKPALFTLYCQKCKSPSDVVNRKPYFPDHTRWAMLLCVQCNENYYANKWCCSRDSAWTKCLLHGPCGFLCGRSTVASVNTRKKLNPILTAAAIKRRRTIMLHKQALSSNKRKTEDTAPAAISGEHSACKKKSEPSSSSRPPSMLALVAPFLSAWPFLLLGFLAAWILPLLPSIHAPSFRHSRKSVPTSPVWGFLWNVCPLTGPASIMPLLPTLVLVILIRLVGKALAS